MLAHSVLRNVDGQFRRDRIFRKSPVDVRHELGRMDILSPESLEAVELLLDPGNHSPGQLARIDATLGAHLLQHGMEKTRQQGNEFD